MATPPTAAITWDDVVNIAAELASVPPAAQTAFLLMVAYQVQTPQWGGRQALGQKYLAAHLATVSRMKGKGPVESQDAGQVSQSYADMMQNGPIGTTSYGLEYKRQVRQLPRVAFGIVT